MARYAIIENNKVINITEWNGDTSMWSPPAGTSAVLATDQVGIGCSYIDGNYVFASVNGDSTTAEKFIETIQRIQEVIPDVGVTTDVIVGFPGETDEE